MLEKYILLIFNYFSVYNFSNLESKVTIKLGLKKTKEKEGGSLAGNGGIEYLLFLY